MKRRRRRLSKSLRSSKSNREKMICASSWLPKILMATTIWQRCICSSTIGTMKKSLTWLWNKNRSSRNLSRNENRKSSKLSKLATGKQTSKKFGNNSLIATGMLMPSSRCSKQRKKRKRGRSKKSSTKLCRSSSSAKIYMILIRFVPFSLPTIGMSKLLWISRSLRTRFRFSWLTAASKLSKSYLHSRKVKLSVTPSLSSFFRSNLLLARAKVLHTTYTEMLARTNVSTTSCCPIDLRHWALKISQTHQLVLDKLAKLRFSISTKTCKWSLIESKPWAQLICNLYLY